MKYPVENGKVTQGFNNPNSYGVGLSHEGWDINLSGTSGNLDCGTSILCVYPGRIIYKSISNFNYGNLVVVESDTPVGKRWTRYCHLQSWTSKGDLVKRGDIIGAMGSTGNSTACHLHLDVLKKKPSDWRFYSKNILEWYVDPRELINATMEPPMEPISDDKSKIDLKGYQTTEETYNVIELGALKSMLRAKDQFITDHKDIVIPPITPAPVVFTDSYAKNLYHQALQAEAWSKL